MKIVSKLFEQLNQNGIPAITDDYSVFNTTSHFRLYVDFENKRYMCINLNKQLDLDFKIKLAKNTLNKLNKCKSVINLAKSNYFENQELNKDLDFKDELKNFKSVLEVKNGNLVNNYNTPSKLLNRLINFNFGARLSNNAPAGVVLSIN
jgi:hypothetical protein